MTGTELHQFTQSCNPILPIHQHSTATAQHSTCKEKPLHRHHHPSFPPSLLPSLPSFPPSLLPSFPPSSFLLHSFTPSPFTQDEPNLLLSVISSNTPTPPQRIAFHPSGRRQDSNSPSSSRHDFPVSFCSRRGGDGTAFWFIVGGWMGLVMTSGCGRGEGRDERWVLY